MDFPFDEVDQRLSGNAPADIEFHKKSGEPVLEHERLSAEEMQRAFALFTRLVGWLWQDGMKNPEGITIRAIVVCWVFLKHLHPLTETQLARGFGKHKQSIGRWVKAFKRDFSNIRNPHMKAK